MSTLASITLALGILAAIFVASLGAVALLIFLALRIVDGVPTPPADDIPSQWGGGAS